MYKEMTAILLFLKLVLMSYEHVLLIYPPHLEAVLFLKSIKYHTLRGCWYKDDVSCVVYTSTRIPIQLHIKKK